jgi:hypothetical protein
VSDDVPFARSNPDAPVSGSAVVLHVRFEPASLWTVSTERGASPLSSHPDVSAAIDAARAYADRHGGGDIVVHDRYRRVRSVGRRPAVS